MTKQINIKINKNIEHRYVEDYISSIEMWCFTNCNGNYTIEVSEETTYHITNKITINFYDIGDATLFKLSPLWTAEVLK